MQFFIQLAGRFHPLLVHLPIGILFLAFLFEFFSRFRKYRWLKKAVQPSLFWGAIFSVFAAITGYFLSWEGGYNERLLSQHQYFGIATAVLSVALYFIRYAPFILTKTKEKQYVMRVLLFLPLIITLSMTGHLGGSLTHGEEFLFAFADEAVSGKEPFISVANPEEAILYHDVVRPILESKCYSCHSSKKQKGDLRLDQVDYIRQGGEHGKVIVDNMPDSSALYKLMLLPLEDEHHMPPKGKPQPSSTEIAIIQTWIAEGASFEKKLIEHKSAEKLKQYIASLQRTAETRHWVPSETVAKADDIILQELRSKGIIVLPVAQESNYLMVNFINAKAVEDSDLNTLIKLKDQIVWLNLGRTSITDDQTALVSKLSNLRWLYLNETKITDSAVKVLAVLPNLEFLNVVNTSISEEGIKGLSALKKLKQVYIYQSSFTREAIEALKENAPTLVIDTGHYSLPSTARDTIIFRRKI